MTMTLAFGGFHARHSRVPLTIAHCSLLIAH